MTALTRSVPGRGRLMALMAFALMIVLPIGWAAWSLNAASVAAETIRSQSVLLDGIRQRLSAQQASPQGAGSPTDQASIYLPGETASIAGAGLQRIVADAIQSAGGRLVESEFARGEPSEEEPGRVDLRVAFDAEIVTLQQVLFQLESGMPVLLLHALSIQVSGATEIAEGASPPLRVTLLVGGFWEAEGGAP